jgi:hypothetical protein
VNKLAVIVLFVGLVACNRKKEEEGTQPLQQVPMTAPTGPAAGSAAPGSAGTATAGTPAGTATAAAARDGAGGATTPAPVACATQTALTCAAGLVDGCTGGLTSVHVCVAADAKTGTPCAQGAALTCPTGQIDACTYAPPYASNHLCVVVPRPTP